MRHRPRPRVHRPYPGDAERLCPVSYRHHPVHRLIQASRPPSCSESTTRSAGNSPVRSVGTPTTRTPAARARPQAGHRVLKGQRVRRSHAQQLAGPQVHVGSGLRPVDLVGGDAHREGSGEAAPGEGRLQQGPRRVAGHGDGHGRRRGIDYRPRPRHGHGRTTDQLRDQLQQFGSDARGRPRLPEQVREPFRGGQQRLAYDERLLLHAERQATPGEQLGLGHRPARLGIHQQPVTVEDHRFGPPGVQRRLRSHAPTLRPSRLRPRGVRVRHPTGARRERGSGGIRFPSGEGAREEVGGHVVTGACARVEQCSVAVAVDDEEPGVGELAGHGNGLPERNERVARIA